MVILAGDLHPGHAITRDLRSTHANLVGTRREVEVADITGMPPHGGSSSIVANEERRERWTRQATARPLGSYSTSGGGQRREERDEKMN
jgi:hypothetical protein